MPGHAEANEKTVAEIRKEKSPKKLRERVETLNKEIQKHRDMINADTYEWRQEDENKMHSLFNERKHALERAEFLEQVEKTVGDITRDSAPPERGGRHELRDQDPGDRKGRRDRGAELTPVERAEAANWALARFLGVRIDAEKRTLIDRAQDSGAVKVGRSLINLRSQDPGPEFKRIQTQLRAGHTIDSVLARDLTVNDGSTSAGYFGQLGFIPQLERAMLYFGPMLQICTVIRTADGRQLDMPFVDDTANEADVVGEAAAVSATQDPTISENSWKSVKLRSKKVKYSAESAQDSVFDLFALLVDLLGERIGRGANRVWTLGSSTDVQGAVPGAAAGVTTAATGLTTDDTLAQKIVALYFSVDPAYRTNGGVFMCNDTHLARFATLKHADGTWMYRLRDGMSDTLWGRPVKANNHMVATLAATDRPLLYGDFSAYWIRLVRDIRIRKFAELHGDNDQDAVQLFRRIGGRYVNLGAVKAMVLT